MAESHFLDSVFTPLTLCVWEAGPVGPGGAPDLDPEHTGQVTVWVSASPTPLHCHFNGSIVLVIYLIKVTPDFLLLETKLLMVVLVAKSLLICPVVSWEIPKGS